MKALEGVKILDFRKKLNSHVDIIYWEVKLFLKQICLNNLV